MRRLSRYSISNKGKGLKGQWLLISAVIITASFLAISSFFRNYFVVDNSKPAEIDEDYNFKSIKNGLNKTVLMSCPNDSDFIRNSKHFIEFSKQKMYEKGYLLSITPRNSDINSISCTLQFHENFPLILLQSDRAEIWEGERS